MLTRTLTVVGSRIAKEADQAIDSWAGTEENPKGEGVEAEAPQESAAAEMKVDVVTLPPPPKKVTEVTIPPPQKVTEVIEPPPMKVQEPVMQVA